MIRNALTKNPTDRFIADITQVSIQYRNFFRYIGKYSLQRCYSLFFLFCFFTEVGPH